MSQRSTAQHYHTDTPFCTIRKSHVTWNFAVPGPHSEEIRRCILLFLCTLDVIDRPRLRSTCSAGAGEGLSPFSVSVSAPRCCGFVTSRSQLRFVAAVGENDSLISFFFQAVTDRCAPAFGAFFYWFSVWRRRRRSAWSWRSTVGGSFFFLSSPLELPAIRLEGILLLTPSLVGLLLQYTRNPQQTGRKQKRSSTHRRSPATNKVVEILTLGTYLLLDCSLDYLRASPSNSRDTPLWSYDFAFLEKALKKMKKITSSSKRETENKKINEPSWSPFDCVTSRVTQQHSRRYFQLDLTMSCRESMLQLQLQFPATRGTLASVPAKCNHERDVKTKAREI